MKTTSLLYFFLLFIHNYTFSQSADELDNLEKYLTNNSSNIDINDLKSSNDILLQSIQNKKLFVLGEGGSHSLKLYDPLRLYLINQFSKSNLHFFFLEAGRGYGNLYNDYLQIDKHSADKLENKFPLLISKISGVRNLYQNGCIFEYRGIDMERAKNFHYSFNNIGIEDAQEDAIPLLRSILRDTSYLHYREKDFFVHQKNFLKHYKIWQENFYNDSSSIKNILPELQYKNVRYLLTNKELNHPLANRNPGMAKNLLDEMLFTKSNSISILSVGRAHSCLGPNGSLVGILNKSEILKDKITVMNVICYECTANGEKLNDTSFTFMKNDKILNVFKKVATGDITLFNLSNLPVEFSYMKDCADLLLFTKYQK